MDFKTVIDEKRIEDLRVKLNETPNYFKNEAKIARHEANKTKDEVRKDFENDIEELRQQLKRDIFQLTEEEYDNYQKFFEKHAYCCGNKRNYALEFEATEIDTAIYCICGVCKTRKNISDSKKF